MIASSIAPEPDTPPAAPTGQRAAFFGLDTIIPGSSLFLLAQGLHQRDLYDMGNVRLAWMRLLFRAGTSAAPQVQIRQDAALAFVEGRHRPDLLALAREIADERIIPRVYPDLARVIDGHRDDGVLTFVATAAPAELAQLVAQGLGMTGGLGTSAEVDDEERYSGRLAGSVLQGTAKALAVEAHAGVSGIDLSASVAYSDSINDLPLLELVGRAEVVNPDRHLRRVARQRGWPVHDVRPRTRTSSDPGRAPVPQRLAALGLESAIAADPGSTRGASHVFTTEDPAALVRELEANGRFRRDSRLGSVFHPGKVSLREVSPVHSLHITVEGDRVSAHVDRYSPMALRQPEEGARYSVHRIVAHNISGIAGELARRLPGRWRRDQACPGRNPPAER